MDNPHYDIALMGKGHFRRFLVVTDRTDAGVADHDKVTPVTAAPEASRATAAICTVLPTAMTVSIGDES